MKPYPQSFSSRSEYEAYLKCISKMELGDMADLYSNRFGFSAHKTGATVRGTFVAREGTSFLFGFGRDCVGAWYIDSSPSDYGYSRYIANWRDYSKAYQVKVNDTPVLGVRIARIYRQA